MFRVYTPYQLMASVDKNLVRLKTVQDTLKTQLGALCNFLGVEMTLSVSAGHPMGLTITTVVDGHPFALAGFVPGDVISRSIPFASRLSILLQQLCCSSSMTHRRSFKCSALGEPRVPLAGLGSCWKRVKRTKGLHDAATYGEKQAGSMWEPLTGRQVAAASIRRCRRRRRSVVAEE